ncbi:MAG: hypothetical protein HRT38_17510 [Alteromonadaceae bacterium]|nr:hypothetical protein [Alteromonadaceae bacterium]
MSIRVFISKGSAATTEQRAFVDAVLDMLDTVGLSPRIMGENEWSHEQPLKAIRKIIKECDGAVVIAFTRTKFDAGIELKKDIEIPVSEVNLPTTWNHIEAAMAYSYELPLLVIAENGLKPEGLIEDGYDWRVYWTDLEVEKVKSDSFKGFLQSWKEAVEDKKLSSNDSEIDLSKIGIGKLFTMISIPQLSKLIGVILTVLTLVAGTAYKLGGGDWPWQQSESNKSLKQDK